MKVTSKNISETKVEIKVTLDAKDLKSAAGKALELLAKEVKAPGFRKGKVPIDVAKQHIPENDINAHALDIAVRSSVPLAFHEAKKAPLIVPSVEVTKYVPGQSAEYTATAEVLPDVKLGDYKNLKVKQPEIKVSKQDIDQIVTNIQNAYAEKKVAKKAAALGDEVVIDFTGSKDGQEFDGGSAKDYKLVLGSGTFIPGFEDGVVGHSSGERFDLNLTFPKDYHNQDLAGAKVVFNVLVKQVNEIIKPALDEKLAQKCGPFKNMDELRADIEHNLEVQNRAVAQDKYKDALVTELVNHSKVAAPEIMVSDQLKYIREDVTRNAASRGLTFEDYLKQTGQTEEDWRREASKIAELRVKSSLVLQILARDEKITASDAEVQDKLDELKTVYSKSKDALEQLKNPNVRQDIKNRLTIDKALDFLVEQNSKPSKSNKQAKK